MSAPDLVALSQSIPVDKICYNEQGLVPAIMVNWTYPTSLTSPQVAVKLR